MWYEVKITLASQNEPLSIDLEADVAEDLCRDWLYVMNTFDKLTVRRYDGRIWTGKFKLTPSFVVLNLTDVVAVVASRIGEAE